MHSENRLLHTQYFSTNCHLHWHSGVRQTSGYSGFTLIELLIVIAIAAVLATVAFPVYTSYVNRAKFSEVVNAVQPYKLAAELAVQTQGATLADLDAGTFDIPASIFAEQSYGKHLGSLDMLDGRITASAKTIVDENNLPLTYILQGQIENDGRITWEVDPSSTCLTNNICSP